jgi:hypothetical protein
LTTGQADKRSSSSDANRAGNLTWLSRRQNALHALSDRWTVMDAVEDAANLRSRGMLHTMKIGEHAGKSALELYEALQLAITNEAPPAKAGALFDAFWKCRQDWMIGQMRGWLQEELSPEAEHWLQDG